MTIHIDYLKAGLHYDRDAYIQLSELITDLIIKEGVFKKGDKLPSADSLAKELGINRLTVQRALQRLVEKGIVSSHKGKGTFVLVNPIQYPKMVVKTKLTTYMSFSTGTEINLIRSERCGADACGPVPEPERAESYQRLVRIHSKQQTPYAFTELFIASEVFAAHAATFKTQLAMRTTLTVIGKENIQGIHQTWTIHKAPKDIAPHLKIAVGDPVVRVFRTIHTKANTAVYVGNITYPGYIVEFDSDWELD